MLPQAVEELRRKPQAYGLEDDWNDPRIIDKLKAEYGTVADLKKAGRCFVALILPLVKTHLSGLKNLNSKWPNLNTAINEFCGPSSGPDSSAAERRELFLDAFTDEQTANHVWWKRHVMDGEPLPQPTLDVPAAAGNGGKKRRSGGKRGHHRVLADTSSGSDSDSDYGQPATGSKGPAARGEYISYRT